MRIALDEYLLRDLWMRVSRLSTRVGLGWLFGNDQRRNDLVGGKKELSI